MRLSNYWGSLRRVLSKTVPQLHSFFNMPHSGMQQAGLTTLTSSSSAMSRWPIAVWALLYLLIAGALQLYTTYPFDADTAYHAAVGRLIREHGILYSFPWTPFSWLADHYADKELLFHLLFVPLAGLSWITAAKIVGTLAGAAILLSMYLVLRAEGVRFAGLWALVPLAASGVFIFQFALVRPYLLSIALAIVVLWAASRGRLAILALTSAIYPWIYVAWQLPVVFVLLAEGARLLSGERIRWKPFAVVTAGLLLGVALHPNAVNLVRLSWIGIVDVLFRNAWGNGIELGQELQPFSLGHWAKWLLVSLFMTIAGLILAWRNRRTDALSLAFALATIAFAVLTLKSAKFAEYFVPFSAATMALVSRSIPWRPLPAAILCVAALYTVTLGSETVTGLATRADDVKPSIVPELQYQIPVGAQVFTCEWGFTGSLMLALPDRRFMVALDPTFFYVKDPELYRLWIRLLQEAPPGTAETIRQRFGARYALCLASGRNRGAFFDRIMSEPGVRLMFVSDMWLLFDLGGPSP